jgi:putative hydrolase of the HAD superfamily
MIRTIFFDFGNVVGFFDHQRAVTRLTEFTDLNAIELTLRLYGGPILDDYECGRIATAEYVREATLNGRLSCTPAEFVDCFCDIFWRNPEVCDLIPRLKPRYRLVLASNTVDAHFRRFSADYADVLAHFDHLVASHHAAARKPHPEFWAYAQRFAHADPGECLFVDDLPVNVEAAVRFGWQGIVYAPDGTLEAKLKAAGVEIGPA